MAQTDVQHAGRMAIGADASRSLRPGRACIRFVCLALLCLAAGRGEAQSFAEQALGAPSQAEPAESSITVEQVEGRLEQAREALRAAERSLPAVSDVGSDHAQDLLAGLRKIESLLVLQASLVGPEASRDDEAQIGPAPSEPSIFALNELYELQTGLESRRSQRAAVLASAREALHSAKERLDAAEKARRKAKAELERAASPDRVAAERVLELRRLASRVEQEEVNLATLRVRTAHRALESMPGSELLDERIASLRASLADKDGDAEAVSTVLLQREEALRRRREALERSLTTLDLRLEAARNRFARQVEPAPELLAELEALTTSRDAIRDEVAVRVTQLDRLAVQKFVWQSWVQILRGGGTRAELDEWRGKLEERVEELRAEKLQADGRSVDVERRLEALSERIIGLAEGAGLRPVLEEKRETLRSLQAAQLAQVNDIAAESRLIQRVLTDAQRRGGDIDIVEQVLAWSRALRDFWDYEITTVDDEPITVGSLGLALVLAVVGLWVSRRASGLVGHVASNRMKLDAGASDALQTLSFYVLLVSFTLLALRMIHFPLTAFTVLGGALAIGVGFGSQNVMNNFISGLILMLERPVRARDMIEVDGNHGTIERIGARSTQIRSTDGRHIVVPNSFFLENNVVNWTLSDDLIRTNVVVGVIYGSPTRLVEQLIEQVVAEEEEVLSSPAPIIIFDEFGDNSLNFVVHFWLRARAPMAMRRVQSRIRFRLDDLFREHGIVIAFPQRDVHLNSVSPLEVRVVGEAPPQAGESPSSEDGREPSRGPVLDD